MSPASRNGSSPLSDLPDSPDNSLRPRPALPASSLPSEAGPSKAPAGAKSAKSKGDGPPRERRTSPRKRDVPPENDAPEDTATASVPDATVTSERTSESSGAAGASRTIKAKAKAEAIPAKETQGGGRTIKLKLNLTKTGDATGVSSPATPDSERMEPTRKASRRTVESGPEKDTAEVDSSAQEKGEKQSSAPVQRGKKRKSGAHLGTSATEATETSKREDEEAGISTGRAGPDESVGKKQKIAGSSAAQGAKEANTSKQTARSRRKKRVLESDSEGEDQAGRPALTEGAGESASASIRAPVVHPGGGSSLDTPPVQSESGMQADASQDAKDGTGHSQSAPAAPSDDDPIVKPKRNKGNERSAKRKGQAYTAESIAPQDRDAASSQIIANTVQSSSQALVPETAEGSEPTPTTGTTPRPEGDRKPHKQLPKIPKTKLGPPPSGRSSSSRSPAPAPAPSAVDTSLTASAEGADQKTAPSASASGSGLQRKPTTTKKPINPNPNPTSKPALPGPPGISSLLSSTLAALQGGGSTPKRDGEGKKREKKDTPKSQVRKGAWADEWVLTPEQKKEFAESKVEREAERAKRRSYRKNPVNLQEAKDAYRLDSTMRRVMPDIPGSLGIKTTKAPSRMVAALLASWQAEKVE